MSFRPRHAIATGVAVLGMLVAAPALAGVGQASDPGGQPPPGSSAAKTTSFVPRSQPPAGSRATKTTDFRLGRQPVNRHPEKAGPSTGLRHSKSDQGKKNLPVTKDRGKKNLPVQQER